MIKNYLLGKSKELLFGTANIPEAIPYYSNETVMELRDNHITMTLTDIGENGDKAEFKIFMTVEQAEGIKKALDIMIERLGR